MKLLELLKGMNLKGVTGNLDAEISHVVSDSRKVTPGALFIAVRGYNTDGHRFVKDAMTRGAAAVIVEDISEAGNGLPNVPVIRVPESRKAMAQVALNYYGNPSSRLHLIGVTGTNGKTTTTYLIKSILEGFDKKVGLIGTVSYFNGSTVMDSGYTTPEAIEFQALLREMVNRKCEFAVTEISSHALALGRTLGTRFSTAVFTNLTQDHLDFHSDMEDYFRAKSLLFSNLSSDKCAVINIDDDYGRRLTDMTPGRIYTYGIKEKGDVRGENIRLNMDGIAFDAVTPEGRVNIVSPLVGIYNVYNILAAMTAAIACGIPLDKIASGVAALSSVPGRFERIESNLGFHVVVDYAHTENALRLLLEAASGFASGRVITLFGCGGDRDRGKRPLMGRAAMELSDYVIVTSDNPRTEDAMSIIEEVTAGIREAMPSGRVRASGYKTIPDRRMAIQEAINMAEKGDLVVIAGKGHECYQIIGNRKQHFDDREEAREAIRKKEG